ncbi:zinc-binding dehydrogenase [Biscogniauxia mediterranea]|nr:zinc-binding dehydrogenase [Biscogniauxia mediterranea]
MASQAYKFYGWQGLDPSSADGKMVWGEFEPKKWEETDIDIKVTHCGMCGTDFHHLKSGWFPAPYPIVVGHEIVGEVVRVGSRAVGGHKVGDRVGVGCLSDCCVSIEKEPCERCSAGQENYCRKSTWTYLTPHHNGDKSNGGYATYHRTSGRMAYKIPESIESRHAATLMCAGATMYSPLRQNGCGPGMKVGIVGLGGLGHYGVLIAKAMGADQVIAISRRESKRNEALALGADDYLATEDDPQWHHKYRGTLDLVIATVASSKAPFGSYMELLKFRGALVQVGSPDDGNFSIPVNPMQLNQLSFTGSIYASPGEVRELLQLVADKNIKPWVEEIPMKNANQALLDMEAGKPRYRYCLVNEDTQKASI